MIAEPSFTIGIEEEYHLVNTATRDLADDPPADLMAGCRERLQARVMPEFLRTQIEVATSVCTDLAAARRELAELRQGVADVAVRHGLAPMASATHPFGDWDRQKPTEQDRYRTLARDLQMVGRRMVICGMHVHVGIEDPELRIDLMNQVSYFLPHLLALSTSSPFWRGLDTGLKSYRMSVFAGLPRTGVPEIFPSWGEYQRLVDVLTGAGLVEDATKIWWDIRPSARFPTLEMRITDVCTRLDDGVAIAALFRCLLRMLWRLRRANQRWRLYARGLIEENRWRAQRYGMDEGLADFGQGAIVPFATLLDEMIDLIQPDIEHFGCAAEVAGARAILARGTSADRQRRIYAEARAAGAGHAPALARVVDHLVAETVEAL